MRNFSKKYFLFQSKIRFSVTMEVSSLTLVSPFQRKTLFQDFKAKEEWQALSKCKVQLNSLAA